MLSMNSDLLKESFVYHLAKVAGTGFLFHSESGHGQLHRLCCERPLISGGRGGTHPASHKAQPAYHNDYSPSVNHSLISPLYTVLPLRSCLPGDRLTLSGLHSTLHTIHGCL